MAERLVFVEKGKVDVERFSVSKPGAREVLVETECTLISPGTERAYLLSLPNTPGSFPIYPGYSNVGRIAEIGDEVIGLSVGDRVVSGATHSSHVVLPSADVAKVEAESIASEEAAFFNLCAISLQGVRKARVEIGESVLVTGLGMIGLLAVEAGRLNGGFPVLAADPIETRRDLATQIGADSVLDPLSESYAEDIAAVTGGLGASVVIEATGNAEAVLGAFRACAWHGRVVLLASTRGVVEKVDFYNEVHRRGIVVIGAHNSIRPRSESSVGFWSAHDDWRVALALISAGRLNVKPLISQRLSWEDAPGAYRRLAEWDPGLLGVILKWNE